MHLGVEIDVAAVDVASNGAGHAETWAPPAPSMTIPIVVTTDVIEVQVFETSEGPRLVGAIELVGPANKDRPGSREAFVAKCHTYVTEGIGLAIVDIVTSRRANLHHELLERLPHLIGPASTWLYAAAYHPVKREADFVLDIWQEPLAVGAVLPNLPLWLLGSSCVRVELEETYLRTCREQRYDSFLPS